MDQREFQEKMVDHYDKFGRIAEKRKKKVGKGITEEIKKHMEDIFDQKIKTIREVDRLSYMRKEKELELKLNNIHRTLSENKGKEEKEKQDYTDLSREDSSDGDSEWYNRREEELNFMDKQRYRNQGSDSRFGKERFSRRGEEYRNTHRNFRNVHPDRQKKIYSGEDSYDRKRKREESDRDRDRGGWKRREYNEQRSDRGQERNNSYKGNNNRYSPLAERSRSPYSDNESRSPYNSGRSRSPSADSFGCFYCKKPHRGLECQHMFPWYREIRLWRHMTKREKSRGVTTSKEEETRLRKDYGIEEEKCKNNPARDRKDGFLEGAGPYCYYCHCKDHPTLFCPNHCPLCDKKNAGHGWRSCSEKNAEAKDIDYQIGTYLDKIHEKWKHTQRPGL